MFCFSNSLLTSSKTLQKKKEMCFESTWLAWYSFISCCQRNSNLFRHGQRTSEGVLWDLTLRHWQEILWVLKGGGEASVLSTDLSHHMNTWLDLWSLEDKSKLQALMLLKPLVNGACEVVGHIVLLGLWLHRDGSVGNTCKQSRECRNPHFPTNQHKFN